MSFFLHRPAYTITLDGIITARLKTTPTIQQQKALKVYVGKIVAVCITYVRETGEAFQVSVTHAIITISFKGYRFSTCSFERWSTDQEVPVVSNVSKCYLSTAVHSIDTFPQSFLVEAVNLIFLVFDLPTLPFNRCLIFIKRETRRNLSVRRDYVDSFLPEFHGFFFGKKKTWLRSMMSIDITQTRSSDRSLLHHVIICICFF